DRFCCSSTASRRARGRRSIFQQDARAGCQRQSEPADDPPFVFGERSVRIARIDGHAEAAPGAFAFGNWRWPRDLCAAGLSVLWRVLRKLACTGERELNGLCERRLMIVVALRCHLRIV